MNKKLIAQRFEKSRQSYSDSAVVQRDMAQRLLDLLLISSGQMGGFTSVFEIGCGEGIFTGLLTRTLEMERLTVNDLYCCKCPDGVEFLPGDIEEAVLPENEFDLVVSNAVFQWLSDVAGLFGKLHKSLKSGGILAFSTFGEDNLREFKALKIPGLNYYPVNKLADFAEGFELIGADEYLHTLEFSSAADVLTHLKETGVTGVSKRRWSRTQLQELVAGYEASFRLPNGLVPLTYHPEIVILRKS